MCGAKCLFYCHFLDQLLASKTSLLKQVYRAPLNWLEELTTGMAHVLMVNSKFTARTFGETFTGLTVVPDVLYPSLNFTAFDVEPDMATIDGLVRGRWLDVAAGLQPPPLHLHAAHQVPCGGRPSAAGVC